MKTKICGFAWRDRVQTCMKHYFDMISISLVRGLQFFFLCFLQFLLQKWKFQQFQRIRLSVWQKLTQMQNSPGSGKAVLVMISVEIFIQMLREKETVI